MCGIVAGIAKREISEILLEGLRRLEYRGYDSAGMALIDNEANLQLHKYSGKVANLENAQRLDPMQGCIGIAHTRWATHGEPSAVNAHPHVASGRVALVHNGIIENYQQLRGQLEQQGVVFVSATDTEVIVHLIDRALTPGTLLIDALRQVLPLLEGAYALAVIHKDHPNELVFARKGSPLVIGMGIGETFVGSDTLALRSVTDTFVYLEDGDVGVATAGQYTLYDADGHGIVRNQARLEAHEDATGLGDYEHYMLKEIHEQPDRLRDTVGPAQLDPGLFGAAAADVFARTQSVLILACGTSYHAGLVARHWIESIAKKPCQVEVASEFRYRDSVRLPGTLVVCISQSGETADTLAALNHANDSAVVARLAICNVDHSAIVRASDLVFLTRAGAEIGVASTKAFTTQLAALMMLTGCLAQASDDTATASDQLTAALRELPVAVAAVLAQEKAISQLATGFIQKHHSLFLGRGIYHPIAMEGALKLKEISYIHAEAYPAGELKHGPLALVDADMPVVAVAPNDELLDKLRSNLEEVRARGGELFVFADKAAGFSDGDGIHVLPMPHCGELAGPVAYTVALQILSYYVAVAKGTDVDKPRNLAKSVTVE